MSMLDQDGVDYVQELTPKNTGMGDLWSEDYRVLYIFYYAEPNNFWDPSPSDCEWYIPGTLELEESHAYTGRFL